MANELERLTNWYREQCDGDWEHARRVHIGTLDNPGWSVNINLSDTVLAGREVSYTHIERTPTDWIVWEVKGDAFVGRGGAGNLVELVTLFLEFAGLSK